MPTIGVSYMSAVAERAVISVVAQEILGVKVGLVGHNEC